MMIEVRFVSRVRDVGMSVSRELHNYSLFWPTLIAALFVAGCDSANTKTAEEPIRLSAGAAVPNSLEGGTVMFFTAEYRFRGQPKTDAHYVFVVEGRGGKTVRIPLARLAARGTLPAFHTQFRPGDGPFQGYVEEWQRNAQGPVAGTGKRVSNVVPLK